MSSTPRLANQGSLQDVHLANPPAAAAQQSCTQRMKESVGAFFTLMGEGKEHAYDSARGNHVRAFHLMAERGFQWLSGPALSRPLNIKHLQTNEGFYEGLKSFPVVIMDNLSSVLLGKILQASSSCLGLGNIGHCQSPHDPRTLNGLILPLSAIVEGAVMGAAGLARLALLVIAAAVRGLCLGAGYLMQAVIIGAKYLGLAVGYGLYYLAIAILAVLYFVVLKPSQAVVEAVLMAGAYGVAVTAYVGKLILVLLGLIGSVGTLAKKYPAEALMAAPIDMKDLQKFGYKLLNAFFYEWGEKFEQKEAQGDILQQTQAIKQEKAQARPQARRVEPLKTPRSREQYAADPLSTASALPSQRQDGPALLVLDYPKPQVAPAAAQPVPAAPAAKPVELGNDPIAVELPTGNVINHDN